MADPIRRKRLRVLERVSDQPTKSSPGRTAALLVALALIVSVAIVLVRACHP